MGTGPIVIGGDGGDTSPPNAEARLAELKERIDNIYHIVEDAVPIPGKHLTRK